MYCEAGFQPACDAPLARLEINIMTPLRLTLCLLPALLMSAAFASQDAEPVRIGLSPQAEKNRPNRVARHALQVRLRTASPTPKKAGKSSKPPTACWPWPKSPGAKTIPNTAKKAVRALSRVSPSSDPDGIGLKALATVAVVEADGSMRALARKALTALDDKTRAEIARRRAERRRSLDQKQRHRSHAQYRRPAHLRSHR